MISVKWKGGEETGFSSRKAAELFIERVCKRIAPDLTFSISETHLADSM
jgi:hypothetical protein